MMIGSSLEPPDSLFPLPDAPFPPLLPPEVLLSRAIILIVILLGRPFELPPAPPAEPAAAAAPPPALVLLRGLLMDADPKLAKRLAKVEAPCLAALLPPALLLADAGLALAAPLALATPADPLVPPSTEAAISEDVSINLNANGGGNPAPGGKEEEDRATPLPDDPLLEPLPAGALANLTRAVLVGLLPLPPAAPSPLAAAAGPFPPEARSSGKNISMTPTIPPLAGRIMRIAGRPSALVPKVTCPVPRSGPPKLVKDAKICSTMAALMGKADKDC